MSRASAFTESERAASMARCDIISAIAWCGIMTSMNARDAFWYA